MKRQIKPAPKVDNVTPEDARKAVRSVKYKEPERRLMMADREGYSRSEPTIDDIKAYLAELEQPMVAVPAEPNGNMVKAALHAIPTEWGVCTGRQMMDIYEAMATAAGEGE